MHSEFELGLIGMIKMKFKDSHLFGVASEARKYNAATSRSSFLQNNGLAPEICEVYFDGKYLCDIPATMSPKDAMLQIENAITAKIKV